MEKNTRTKNILLIVLLVAVLTLSIAYAGLSQYLYINSQTVVGGSSTNWDIKFTAANCSGGGYATVTNQFSGTNTTVLQGMTGTVRAPGDSINCDITVQNAGQIDATLSTFTLQDGTLTYTGSGESKTTDEGLVNGKLAYSLTYDSSDTMAPSGIPDGTNTGTATVNDDLPHGQSRNLKLTITYPLSETSMPTNDVAVTGFKTTFLYVQK